MNEIKTDADTQLFVGLSESTGVDREKSVFILMRDETSDEDKELFAQMTADQTKDLIKVLQRKVASIEKKTTN